MASTLLLLLIVIALALAFDYINGFHDTANAVATVVSTNVLPGRTAVLMAALFNFVGAFIGVGVAKTIVGDVTDPASVTQTTVCAALLGAIFWNLLTWYYGIPSSSSHALIGGLVGAIWCHQVLVHNDPAGLALGELLTSKGVTLTLAALVLSPLCGLLGGFSLMVGLTWLTQRWKPAMANRTFRVLQLLSAGFMAFSHGSNDAQKSMGIITMALVAYVAMPHAGTARPDSGTLVSLGESQVTMLVPRKGQPDEEKTYELADSVEFTKRAVGGDRILERHDVEETLRAAKGKLPNTTLTTATKDGRQVVEKVTVNMDVPWWVILLCATAMGLGTASGGWRIMKTMGHKIIKLRPVNGFAAESAAATVILTATALHAPVSTTHVISASIMGVGASKRVSAVRWGVAGNILVAWVLTIPISSVVSALTYAALRLLIGD